MEENKDLNYWKNNAEEDYMHTPISVLRYITELEQQVKSVDLADVGGSLLNDVHVDYFENVECEIDGEMKDMHEYRILVEPDSKQHLTMEKIFGEQ